MLVYFTGLLNTYLYLLVKNDYLFFWWTPKHQLMDPRGSEGPSLRTTAVENWRGICRRTNILVLKPELLSDLRHGGRFHQHVSNT